MSSNLISTRSMSAKTGDIANQSYAYAGLTLQSLRATIGPLQDNRLLFHFVIGISGILPCYNGNLTLQTFRSLKFFSPGQLVLWHGFMMLPPQRREAGLLAISLKNVQVCRHFGSPFAPVFPWFVRSCDVDSGTCDFRLDSSRLFYPRKFRLVIHTKCRQGAFCMNYKAKFTEVKQAI